MCISIGYGINAKIKGNYAVAYNLYRVSNDFILTVQRICDNEKIEFKEIQEQYTSLVIALREWNHISWPYALKCNACSEKCVYHGQWEILNQELYSKVNAIYYDTIYTFYLHEKNRDTVADECISNELVIFQQLIQHCYFS